MSDRFPFPIPNGWFQVEWSHDLKAGDVKPLKYFGKDLVLFRDEDGAAHLLDAFCPHLGAHLGHGGKVEGKDIVCYDLCLFISEDGALVFGEISQDCGRYRHFDLGSLDKDVWRAGGSSESVLAKWQLLLDLIGQ